MNQSEWDFKPVIDRIVEQERKKRWLEFYEGGRSSVVLIHYDHGRRPLPNPPNLEQRIEYSLRVYRERMEMTKWLDDDYIPHLAPYTGTEIFAEAFGCCVQRPEDNMPFALPLIHSSSELSRIKIPEVENSSLTRLFEIADRLRVAEPGAVMMLPDIQSPFDIAALIWEKEDFFAALYEDPDAVKELAAMTEKLLTDFLDLWFARYGKEFIAHYPDYYMPYGITLSEDEVGTISPEMFREFSLGCLNRLSGRYGMLGVHCCANAVHQWENFRDIRGLKLLNLVQPCEVQRKAYAFFRDICCQMHSEEFDGTVELGTRVVLHASASGRDEAVRICTAARSVI